MKGIDTWPVTLRGLKRLTKPRSRGMEVSLLRTEPGRVELRVGVAASPQIRSLQRQQRKSHMRTAEGQIQTAKRNILLLLFFTFTLCLLYTVIIMQVIK